MTYTTSRISSSGKNTAHTPSGQDPACTPQNSSVQTVTTHGDLRKNPDAYAPLVLAVGAILTVVGFVLAFTIAAPVNGARVDGVEMIGGQMVGNQMLLSQKIFYFHMPVAITSFALITCAAYFGVRYLSTKKASYDLKARLAEEVSLVFVVMVMVSGEMWERFEWGIWWTWDPRLTTYFILMLLVIAYFVLRAAIDDPERRASYASVVSIVTFVDVPICFMITRMIPSSIHPTIFRSDSGLSPDMLIPLVCVLVGMLCIAWGIFRWRYRLERIQDAIDQIKQTLDE